MFRQLFLEREQAFILDAANSITPAWSGSCGVAKKIVGSFSKSLELCDEIKKGCAYILEGQAQAGFNMMIDEEKGAYILLDKYMHSALENALMINKIMTDADNIIKQIIKITAEKQKIAA